MRMPWVAPKRACSDLAATRFSAHSERGMNKSLVDLRKAVSEREPGGDLGWRFARVRDNHFPKSATKCQIDAPDDVQ